MDLMRRLVGVALIAYALFNDRIPASLDISNLLNTPTIQVDTPSEEDKAAVKDLSGKISDRKDQLKFAISHKEFSERVKLPKYEVSSQVLQNVYVDANKRYFGTNMKKYGTGTEITKVFKSVIGENDHIVSLEERTKLANRFNAIAWLYR